MGILMLNVEGKAISEGLDSNTLCSKEKDKSHSHW